MQCLGMQGIAPSGPHDPCAGGHDKNLDRVQTEMRQLKLAAIRPTDFILLPPPIMVNFIANLRLRFSLGGRCQSRRGP